MIIFVITLWVTIMLILLRVVGVWPRLTRDERQAGGALAALLTFLCILFTYLAVVVL